jgi:hypothetical protein
MIDITALQTIAQSFMTTPCAIARKTLVSDGMGGNTYTWAIVSAAGLLCRVSEQKQQGQEVVAESRIEARRQWLVRLPAGTDVAPPDRIVAFANTGWTLDPVSGLPSSGNAYEVDTVAGPKTFEAERVAFCWLIQ